MKAKPNIEAVGATDDLAVAVVNLSVARAQLRVWDLEDGTPRLTCAAPSTLGAAAVAPGRGELLVATAGVLRLYALPGGQKVQLSGLHRNQGALQACYSGDERRFAVLSVGQIGVWDANTRERIGKHSEKPKARRRFTAMALSPDGSELAVSGYQLSKKKVVAWLEIYSAPELALLRRGACEMATTLDWTERGLFVGTEQGLALYDARSLKKGRKCRVSSRRAFARDGSRVASVATRGDKASVVELSTWTTQAVYAGRKGPAREADVALAGSRLVVGRGWELSVWDADAGEELWSVDLAQG